MHNLVREEGEIKDIISLERMWPVGSSNKEDVISIEGIWPVGSSNKEENKNNN